MGQHELEAQGWEELALRIGMMERSGPNKKHVQVLLGWDTDKRLRELISAQPQRIKAY